MWELNHLSWTWANPNWVSKSSNDRSLCSHTFLPGFNTHTHWTYLFSSHHAFMNPTFTFSDLLNINPSFLKAKTRRRGEGGGDKNEMTDYLLYIERVWCCFPCSSSPRAPKTLDTPSGSPARDANRPASLACKIQRLLLNQFGKWEPDLMVGKLLQENQCVTRFARRFCVSFWVGIVFTVCEWIVLL